MSLAQHPTVSLATAARMIRDFGTTNTIVLLAEPGIGKSSILKAIAAELPTHDAIYVDCPTFDVPDVGMAIPDQQEKKLEFFINEVFKLSGKGATRPKLIMLDEIAKAMGTTKLAFNRLMLEQMLLGKKLPEGSIVFATSNNASDGVGDKLMAHGINRVTVLRIRKDLDKWVDWAMRNNVNPMLISWVKENSYVFRSYDEEIHGMDAKQREARAMAFNPNNPAAPFASPRSIAGCSPYVDKLADYEREEMTALLAGTVGIAAAVSMMAYFNVLAKVVSFDKIIADPEGVEVVSDGCVPVIQCLNAVQRIKTVHELEQWLTFMLRMERDEPKMLFTAQMQAIKPDLAPRSERLRMLTLKLQTMI